MLLSVSEIGEGQVRVVQNVILLMGLQAITRNYHEFDKLTLV